MSDAKKRIDSSAEDGDSGKARGRVGTRQGARRGGLGTAGQFATLRPRGSSQHCAQGWQWRRVCASRPCLHRKPRPRLAGRIVVLACLFLPVTNRPRTRERREPHTNILRQASGVQKHVETAGLRRGDQIWVCPHEESRLTHLCQVCSDHIHWSASVWTHSDSRYSRCVHVTHCCPQPCLPKQLATRCMATPANSFRTRADAPSHRRHRRPGLRPRRAQGHRVAPGRRVCAAPPPSVGGSASLGDSTNDYSPRYAAQMWVQIDIDQESANLLTGVLADIIEFSQAATMALRGRTGGQLAHHAQRCPHLVTCAPANRAARSPTPRPSGCT